MQRIAASDWAKLTPKLATNSKYMYALGQVHHVRMLEHVTHFALASRPVSQCSFYNSLGYFPRLCCTYNHRIEKTRTSFHAPSRVVWRSIFSSSDISNDIFSKLQ